MLRGLSICLSRHRIFNPHCIAAETRHNLFTEGELDLPFSNANTIAKLSQNVSLREWHSDLTRAVRLMLESAT